MKKLNPDTVSRRFQRGERRAAARPDHGQPRLPPEPAAGRATAGPASGPRAGPRRLPAHPRARQRRKARREDQDPARHAGIRQMNTGSPSFRTAKMPAGPALPSPPVLATPCWPAIAMPCQLALATPSWPAMSVRPGQPGLCRPGGPGLCRASCPHARPEALAGPAAEEAPVATGAPARIATPAVPAGPAAPAAPAGPAGPAERAVIGDQLRMPIMWCKMGSASPGMPIRRLSARPTPGPRDRSRGASMPSAGGRPRCQQTDPPTGPPAR